MTADGEASVKTDPKPTPKKRTQPNPIDLLFPNTHRELFNAILDEEGLKTDREDRPRTAYSLHHTYVCLRLIEGADIYQVAKNCRTSVEMIEKFYAAHIKTSIDVAAINVMEPKQPRPAEHAEQPNTRQWRRTREGCRATPRITAVERISRPPDSRAGAPTVPFDPQHLQEGIFRPKILDFDPMSAVARRKHVNAASTRILSHERRLTYWLNNSWITATDRHAAMSRTFQPKFTITPAIAKPLMRIEAAKQSIMTLPVTPRVLAHLRETARLFSTHYSTQIEGNRLTPQQVA